jgi:hypothetical protein
MNQIIKQKTSSGSRTCDNLLLQVMSKQFHVLHQLQVLRALLLIVLASFRSLLIFDNSHLPRVSRAKQGIWHSPRVEC